MSYCWHKNRPSQKFKTQIFCQDTTKISGQIQDVLNKSRKSGKSGQVGALIYIKSTPTTVTLNQSELINKIRKTHRKSFRNTKQLAAAS